MQKELQHVKHVSASIESSFLRGNVNAVMISKIRRMSNMRNFSLGATSLGRVVNYVQQPKCHQILVTVAWAESNFVGFQGVKLKPYCHDKYF